MKQVSFGIPQLFSHSPKWASTAMTILSFIFGLWLACLSYDLFSFPQEVEHKVAGVYGVLNLMLLAFGAKKPESLVKPEEAPEVQKEDVAQ